MTDFPTLHHIKRIAIDLETKDPELKKKGPGPRRPGTFIAGLAVGIPGGHSWYFPINHERGFNYDADRVFQWARENICEPNQVIVGANLDYDLDYLWHYGVPVCGPIEDVLLAEPLIDENQMRISLDTCARKYLGETKVETALYEWCASKFGGEATRADQIGNVWRAPGSLVEKYAKGDVDLPLRIIEKQKVLLDEMDMLPLFEMECALGPILLRMRQHGVRVVGHDKLANLENVLSAKQARLHAELDAITPNLRQDRFDFFHEPKWDVWSPESLAIMFDDLNITYPLTKKTKKPSITAKFLDTLPGEIGSLIRGIRQYGTIKSTFLNGIHEYAIDDRIHGVFHQLRPRTGRLSSSNPNLQNLPSKGQFKGLVRGLFLPDENHQWVSSDYSQVEYRIGTSIGLGSSASAARNRYNADPTTDFHTLVQEMVLKLTGVNLDRKLTKNINFGLAYGMGLSTLAMTLFGVVNEDTLYRARKLRDAYFQSMPFVKKTFEKCAERAGQRGWVKTLMNRRRRFDLWESRDWNNQAKALPYYAAKNEWGAVIRRAGTHKAYNAVIQGIAADIIKAALVALDKAGIFSVCPLLFTVHDDINVSKPPSTEADQAIEEMTHIMENTTKIRVPLKVDVEVGPNFGELTKW